MLRKNNILLGVILGLVIPFVGYALFLEIFDQLHNFGISDRWGDRITFKDRTLWLIVLCLNLIPFSYYSKVKFTQTMRGVMISTILYAMGWLFFFGKAILANS